MDECFGKHIYRKGNLAKWAGDVQAIAGLCIGMKSSHLQGMGQGQGLSEPRRGPRRARPKKQACLLEKVPCLLEIKEKVALLGRRALFASKKAPSGILHGLSPFASLLASSSPSQRSDISFTRLDSPLMDLGGQCLIGDQFSTPNAQVCRASLLLSTQKKKVHIPRNWWRNSFSGMLYFFCRSVPDLK